MVDSGIKPDFSFVYAAINMHMVSDTWGMEY